MLGRARSMTRACLAALLASFLPAAAGDASPLLSYLERPPADDIIYFVLPDRFENGDHGNDRGGLPGGPLDHGFDPARKGFYHGGDLKGLADRLDYVAGLGATAIWLGPIYRNKPVQGPPGAETAGYHGYWITDFTDVDPHFGTRDDLKRLVEEAHARNIKVYLDIIVNHTADVIRYEECHGADAAPGLAAPGACPYRSKADFPYNRRGGRDGPAINPGFAGGPGHDQTHENFSTLSDPSYAYMPLVAADERDIKVPAWLNDVTLYHNRGDSAWHGENAVYGDFLGLDDLFTENPRVRDGFIDIYKQWITDFRIDGFRIDTAKHVNADFWPVFNAAMIAHAEGLGIPNFYIFGEVYSGDPVELARFTRLHGFPAVLDFAFQEAVVDMLARGAPGERLGQVFRADALYSGGEEGARQLPTFIGGHDAGRFAHFIRAANPGIAEEALADRTLLGHALMMFARGIPVIYYGDEQGFAGDGGDQDAREDMFPSRVAAYNDNDLVATDRTTADSNFDTRHPLYRAISDLARIYHAEPALRRGHQAVRLADRSAGLFALSRIAPGEGGEILFAANMTDAPRAVRIEVDSRSEEWTSLSGTCNRHSADPALYDIDLPARSFVLCKSNPWPRHP